MRILVTGGAGFIGSHLCEALLARGDEITIFDNFEPFYPEPIKRANLTGALDSGANLLEGDIRDADRVWDAVQRSTPDKIIHLAAQAGARPSLSDPQLYVDINITGTLNVLEAVRRRGTCDVVFASSSSVYGLSTDVPFRESDPLQRPASPYGATKAAGEFLCHAYSHLYELNITALRFFTAYGPRQRPDMAIHKFARLLTEGKPVPLYGQNTVRDYTFITDIVAGILAAIDRPVRFRVYNLGGGRTTALDRMVSLLAEALALPLKVDRRGAQPGDVPATFADVTRASRELAYKPAVPFENGVRLFAEWFQMQAAVR